MVTWRVPALILILIATIPNRPADPPDRALWPGSRFTEADRAHAVDRGLSFIYQTALDPANFRDYGADYIWCLYEIASTSADARLRARATAMARERAREWLCQHSHVKPDASADDIADTLFGAYAAERLGFRADQLRREIREAVPRFQPADYLGFDPAAGPPSKITEMDEVLCDALIAAYTADQYGVMLGAPYAEVARWLRAARPYRPDPHNLIPTINLVTHVVYTHNGYMAHPASRDALPDEFAFLRTYATDRGVLASSELLGEFMDTLRAFGLTTQDEIIQRGFTILLSKQNSDGSWGDPANHNVYQRYHATWTAIDGLRDYSALKQPR